MHLSLQINYFAEMVSFSRDIQVKVSENQEKSLSDLQTSIKD